MLYGAITPPDKEKQKYVNTKEYIFSLQINELIKEYKAIGIVNKYITKKLVIINCIPKILIDIGFKGENITFSVDNVFKVLNDHKIESDIKTLRQLPDKIVNPLAIIKSTSRTNSIVMIVDLDNKFEHKLIVAISLQKTHIRDKKNISCRYIYNLWRRNFKFWKSMCIIKYCYYKKRSNLHN
ncbi:MAG: hypothetical protein LBV51_01015 [Acholeplasmatales bacterium]|jgi:hypothetical protein|nr:hypothetical protein [Acholeplasmatales bacterium]